MSDDKEKRLHAFLDAVAKGNVTMPAPSRVSTFGVAYAKSELVEEYFDTPKQAVVVFRFSEPGYGFGEFTFKQDEHGQLFINTERTDMAHMQAMFTAWTETAITDCETDPERHRRYNEFMQSTCGERCEICYPKKSA